MFKKFFSFVMILFACSCLLAGEDGAGPADQYDCSICQEVGEMSDLVQTPCGHIFHRACIQRWFMRHNNCPNCRCDNLSAADLQAVNRSLPRAAVVRDARVDAELERVRAELAQERASLMRMQDDLRAREGEIAELKRQLLASNREAQARDFSRQIELVRAVEAYDLLQQRLETELRALHAENDTLRDEATAIRNSLWRARAELQLHRLHGDVDLGLLI